MNDYLIAEAKKRDSTKWKHRRVTWEEFCAALQEPFRSPETMREYARMGKTERDRLKEMPGAYVTARLKDGRRLGKNVLARSMVTLDADYARVGPDGGPDAWKYDWENFTCLHDELRAAAYPTHSSTPARPRLRWILPASRDMTPEEYPAVARMVASWIGINTLDTSSYDLNRLFYYPGVPKDAPYELLEQDGEPLDVDAILASYGPGEAWRDCTLWPRGEAEQVTVHNGEPAPDPREKKSRVGLFCRTFDVKDVLDRFLGNVYAEGTNGRYTYINGSTSNGGIILDNGLFFRSYHGTDPVGAGGHQVNAFDLARIALFSDLDADSDAETPVAQLPSYEHMGEWMDGLPEVQAQRAAEDAEQFERDFGDLLTRGTEQEEDRPDEDPDAWKQQLTIGPKTKRPEPTLHNAILLLENLPDFRAKIGHNPMNDTITVQGELPWWAKRRNSDDIYTLIGDDSSMTKETLNGDRKPWAEGDWPEYYAYFEPLGFATGGQKNGVLDNALRTVAGRNEYHPIRNYLVNLVWDGTERLDTLFIRWLGAEDNRLNRVITRRWMMAAVDRVMRPGCQFDQILITKGPQGIGKSRLLRQLAKGYFTSSIKALDVGKTTSEMLQGIWIAEIGELDAMKRGEQTGIKNFITTVSDRYRGAYARVAEEHPRQCVLAGTSNEGSFLRDETGERRYWIMPVTGTGDRGELRGFKEEVDQLWAEAVVAYKQRMVELWQPGMDPATMDLYLYLREDDLEAEMEARRGMFKLPDEDRTDVEEYLNRLRPENWDDMSPAERRTFIQGDGVYDLSRCTYQLDRVCIKEVCYELFGRERGSKEYRVADILDSLPGWRKSARRAMIKAYGTTGRLVWVRIGGRYDSDVTPGTEG